MLSQVEFKDKVLSYIESSLCNDKAVEEWGKETCQRRFRELMACLSIPPSYTTVRYNTLQDSDVNAVIEKLTNILTEQYSRKHRQCPRISVHPLLSDCLLIENEGPVDRAKVDKEVMVDISCGAAVLRGADVFVQGVLAASPGMQREDVVSVYADIDHKCRRGLVKVFEGRKVFLGNGRAKYSRDEIFSTQALKGVGIEMTEPLYVAPSLSDLDQTLFFPQNLPSILCAHVLAPRPGDMVLDLCAAPGGKTTHIATLMKNQGRVVALDKSSRKIGSVESNALRWGLNCVDVYCFDGTKSVDNTAETSGGPPYPSDSFDRVLLDAPCSGLGQRPAIHCSSSLAEVSSYPPLQRRLFHQAVQLLKPGGTLVYSTCTITTEENEGIVVWALQAFPQLTLVQQTPSPYIGRPGWPCAGLSEEQRNLIQRYVPTLSSNDSDVKQGTSSNDYNSDTIGFFIAKFVKNRPC